jgi:hypothetical protein
MNYVVYSSCLLVHFALSIPISRTTQWANRRGADTPNDFWVLLTSYRYNFSVIVKFLWANKFPGRALCWMIGFCFLLHVLSICMAIAYCQLYSWSCFPLIILVRYSMLLGTSREWETLVSPGDQASWSSALNVWHMNSEKQLEPLWSPRSGRFSCGTEVCTWILKFILILTSSTLQDRKYCGEWFLEQAFVKRMFSNYLEPWYFRVLGLELGHSFLSG